MRQMSRDTHNYVKLYMNIVPSIFTVTKILSHGQNLIYITLAIQNGLHEIRGENSNLSLILIPFWRKYIGI